MARFAMAPLLLLVAGHTARAQEWVGFARSCNEVSAFSRNDLGNLAGEAMTRLDSNEHAGWGAAIAGFRTITGVTFASLGGITPQTLDILLYPESAANSNLPCVGACSVAFALGVPVPLGPVCMTLTGLPVSVPIAFTGDVFLSFKLGAAPFPGWPFDGTGIGVITGYPGVVADDFTLPAVPLTNFDRPGPNAFPGAPTLLPTGTYGLRKIAGAGYRSSRQHWFDVQAIPWGATATYPGAGGVGIVWNNQTSYPTGATGTSNFLSGTSPVCWPSGANGNPLTRSDDIGMGIRMSGLSGMLVFFCAQFSNSFGTETPVTFAPLLAPPMSTGTLCLVTNNPQLFVVVAFATADVAEMRYHVPGGSWLGGLPLIQQAFAFDPSTGLIHASPCDFMRL